MGIGGQELLLILVIIVLMFGAKKIPELAKGLGQGIKSFKKEMNSEEAQAEEAKKVEPTATTTASTTTTATNVEHTAKPTTQA